MSVARNGGFTAAQTELNIGQSTISSYISTLETRFGMKLCNRGRAGFSLTESGQKVFEAGEELLAGLESFRVKVGSARDELVGDYAIGMVDAVSDLGDGIVPSLLRDFVGRAPNLHLKLHLSSPQSLVTNLMDRKLHAIILPVFREPAGIELVSLDATDPQELYCGAGHPFFDRADEILAPEEVQEAAFVHRAHMEGWSRYSANNFNAMATTVDVECQLILVLTGLFISYLPRRYAREYVRKGVLRKVNTESLDYLSNVCLAVRVDDTSTATRHLVSLARSLSQSGTG